MKKLIVSLCIGLVFTIVIGNFSSFANECNDIRGKVLRIHVLANSNEKFDQALKLKVRDKVLEASAGIFDNINLVSNAKEKAKEKLPEILKAAQKEVYDNGYKYVVKAEVVNMFFNTRYYGEVTLPAGRYDAVRVTIGEAKGKNWWCVMFPQMCIPTAEKKKELSKTLSKSEVELVSSPKKYKVKFAIVEIIEKIANKDKKNV